MAKNTPIAPATESSPQTESYAKQDIVSGLPDPIAPLPPSSLEPSIDTSQDDGESWYEGFFW